MAAGVPGVSHHPEEVTPFHESTDLNDLTVQMGIVDRLRLLGITDPDDLTAYGRRSHARHAALGCRHNVRSSRREDVHPAMLAPATVAVVAEHAQYGPGRSTLDRKRQRSCGSEADAVVPPAEQLRL